MRVALPDVGRCGKLDLVFALRGGQTILSDFYCEVPFKITRALSTAVDGVSHVMLMHCTAGLFGGDRVEMTVRVERGARVRLTQQSATRVHPSEGRIAVQTSRIHVESGGELELLLDPVIPFAESRFEQKTLIEIEKGARLRYWEGLMAGRIGRGEIWEFDELSSETSLRSEGRLVFLDRFRLQPKCSMPSTPWGMSCTTYTGTGLYVGNDAANFAAALHDALPKAGVDVLENGLAVTRILTSSGPEFHHCRGVFTGNATALEPRVSLL
jgi:urease accessory protein